LLHFFFGAMKVEFNEKIVGWQNFIVAIVGWKQAAK
jgi:hypothetical protein